MSPVGWTTERIALCKRLYVDEGLSATQTAKRLGGVTRMAVIGKANRMAANDPAWIRGGEVAQQNMKINGKAHGGFRGLAKAPKPPRTIRADSYEARGQVARAVNRAAEPKPAPFVDKSAASGERGAVALVELTGATCKFPIGDPRAEDFGFCGAQSVGEGPYCSRHARVCFKPEEKKGPKSASELIRSCRRYA